MRQSILAEVLSVYRIWLGTYENRIGEETDLGTKITDKLISTIQQRYKFLLNGETSSSQVPHN